MTRYREIDPALVATRPVAGRETRFNVADLARRVEAADARLLSALPDVLGASSLRAVIDAAGRASRTGKPIILMLGGHVIKTGCSPFLIQLMELGIVRAVAMNGATAIHDFEIASFGATSEDVEAELDSGTFGMSRETAEAMNGATGDAAARQEGLGEGLGRHLQEAPHAAVSILAAAYRLSIPATVHVALGTDVLHQHSTADGAAIGETSLRDFRILAGSMSPLSGGVVLNFGSAVILPEVFLKAFSLITNLGEEVRDLTTCDFDFIRHYRPMRNVVQRPTAGGRGQGYAITGHHEVMIPLLVAGILENLER